MIKVANVLVLMTSLGNLFNLSVALFPYICSFFHKSKFLWFESVFACSLRLIFFVLYLCSPYSSHVIWRFSVMGDVTVFNYWYFSLFARQEMALDVTFKKIPMYCSYGSLVYLPRRPQGSTTAPRSLPGSHQATSWLSYSNPAVSDAAYWSDCRLYRWIRRVLNFKYSKCL